jgi:FkbM family methyltransferase
VITNTKVLFSAVLKALRADCVCDIGSRDGDQALLFRHLRPEATVLAFEANPINFQQMANDPRLVKHQIQVLPLAVSNARGTAQFHITDVDYDDPNSNKGTSSLLGGGDVKVKGSVEVETCRIDEVVPARCSNAEVVGLWIDVEGAEFDVLEGMSGIRDRVVAVHVETARVPFREGQKTLEALVALMRSYGFQMAGSNIPKEGSWGDVVFVSERTARTLGVRLAWCKLKGHLARWVSADHAAVFLKARWPACYRVLRRAYLRVGT